MKFIFPQNYNFNTKLFGIIDYKTTIFNILLIAINFLIIKFINLNLSIKITFIIIFYFPILLVSLFGFHNENIIYVFRYIFIFFIRNKIYIYKKD